MYKEMLNLVNN